MEQLAIFQEEQQEKHQEEQLRTCKVCGKALPLSKYRKVKDRPDGYRSECKPCANVWAQGHRSRSCKEDPITYRCREMLRAAKNRARKKNIECTLVLEDILALAKQPRCPITRKPFDWKKDTALHSSSPDAPTLDRIDPLLGYTPDNVWIISARMNRIKNDATPRELALLSRSVNNETMRRICSDF